MRLDFRIVENGLFIFENDVVSQFFNGRDYCLEFVFFVCREVFAVSSRVTYKTAFI